MRKVYPPYKDAAGSIAFHDQRFYSDSQLAELLEENIESDGFQFAKLNLIKYLLDEFGIDFIRVENEDGVKGYKIATPVESVRITAKRLHSRIRNATRKHGKVLSNVDRAVLPADVQKEFDARLIRGGLLAAFLSQTPLKKCIEGIKIRLDHPTIIDRGQ